MWWSGVDLAAADVDRLLADPPAPLRHRAHVPPVQADPLGWTCPKIRTPQAANRWTWLILAAYTQLRLARTAAADLRRPREKPTPPQRLSPARVRRGFRHLHATAPAPLAHRNPPGQDLDGHPAAATPSPPHVTTSTSRPPRRTTNRAPRRRGPRIPPMPNR